MADAKLAGTLYKILGWSSLAGLILTIGLVLHKSPAPDVPFDRNAAARAEEKFQAADQAKAAGQPGQVALDSSELNSYMTQNLRPQALPASGSQADGRGATAGPAADGANGANDPSAALAAGDTRSL